MDLLRAIEETIGVTLEDMRSPLRTTDRKFARAIYSSFSDKSRGDLARELNKAYNSITYYRANYNYFYRNNAEFRQWADKIKSLI